jgi:O-antigen ligase
MLYVVASQALLDLRGWSSIAFAIAVLLSVSIFIGKTHGLCRIEFGRSLWVPVAFIGYCLLRSFSTVKDTAPLDVLASVTSAFLGGVAVAAAMQAGVRFKTLVYAQLASCVVQLVIIFLGIGPEPNPGEEDSFRLAGLTGNANELALQLTLGACLIWLRPRRSGLIACGSAFACVAAALTLTGSRKAVLIGLFFLVLLAVQLLGFMPRRRRLQFGVLLSFPVLVAVVLATPTLLRYSTELLAVQRAVQFEDSSYRLRAQMIDQAIQLWRQNPLFGNGLDAFRGLSGQGTYAHNNYVELLCDVGLVGVALFYAMHVQVLYLASRLPRLQKLCCWVFVLMLAVADVGYVSYKRKQTVMLLMVLLGLVVVRRHSVVHEKRTRERDRDLALPVRPKIRRFVTQS